MKFQFIEPVKQKIDWPFLIIAHPDKSVKTNKSLKDKDEIQTKYFFENYNLIRDLYEEWYMDIEKYLNILQWLPTEIFEDLIDLVVKIKVEKSRYINSSDYVHVPK